MQKRQYFWLFGFVAGLAAIGLYIQKWNRQFLKYQMQTKALPTDAGQLHLGKQVQVSTLLECPAEKVWQLVLTSGLTEHLTWPWITFTPHGKQDMPALWKEHEAVEVQLRLFDLVPIGWHQIIVEKIDQESFRVQTKEKGQFLPTWNHLIELQSTTDDRTVYTDSIDVYAGTRTGMAASLVSWFLRYRQARLRKLAISLGRGAQA